MLNDLQTLSDKTNALVAVVTQLRQENTRLRSQTAQLAADQKALQERLALAAQKLESVIEQLPQDS